MTRPLHSLRRARLLPLAVAAGLALSTAAVTTATGGAAQSAVPVTGVCDAAYPVADLAKGDAVDGLTVTSGTTPEPFSGEYLGTLTDGIAPGVDMVLVRLTSAEIDRVGGIWQGMSGSPVYASDGRLIGAVAYGLSYGPSPVAGVTPYADMDDYLGAGAPPLRVPVGSAMARTIAAGSDVSAAQATEGFRQLPMPLGVSGLSGRRIAQAAEASTGHHSYLPKDGYAVGRSTGGNAAGPESIVAGGNMAASLSYGDVTQAGVGTATSVCAGRVVGFGHPMAFLGETTEGLHPADALFIQEDSLGSPFKVANISGPAGTVSDDHLTGITGSFGDAPDSTEISSTVRYRDRARTGTSYAEVAEVNAGTTFFELVANHDRVLDGIVDGSEVLSWTIQGTDPAGAPFSLAFTDRFTSRDLAFETSFDLADLVYALSNIQGIDIASVHADSQADDDSSTYRLSGLQQHRAGEWTRVDRTSPIIGRAGRKVSLRTVLTSAGGTRYEPFGLTVPARAIRRGQVYVTGGDYSYSDYYDIDSLAKAKRVLSHQVRNDELQIEAFFGASNEHGIRRSKVDGPLDKVIDGFVRAPVQVK